MKFIAKTEQELVSISKQFIELVNPKRCFAFKGEMGVGKTTFISYLTKELGIEEETSSPTYGYLNEYVGPNNIIYHFDLYRIESEEEAYDIGIEEYIYGEHWVFIEWAENIANLLPKNCVWVNITKNKLDERIIEVSLDEDRSEHY